MRSAVENKAFAKAAALVVTVAVCAALPLVVSSYWLSLLSLGLVLSVFAASVNLLAGYGGMVTLGQAGTFAAAGYTVAYLSTRTGAGYGAQIASAMAVVVVLSMIFGLMAVRTSGVYFLMVTLAQGMVVWGLTSSLSMTGGGDGIPNVDRPGIVDDDTAFFYLCLAVAGVVTALLAVFVRSPFGLGLRAIKANEERAKAVGYNTTLFRFAAFVASGAMAGVAGVLFVFLNGFIGPSAAYFQMSADGMVMALIGGLGTIVGPFVGAAVLVIIKNVLSTHLDRWPTVEGVFFVLMVLYARQGLVGLAAGGWRKLVARRRRQAGGSGVIEDEVHDVAQVAAAGSLTEVGLPSAGPQPADDTLTFAGDARVNAASRDEES